MDNSKRNAIASIKGKIKKMLSERQSLTSSTSAPSQYWSDFCSVFDYMLELPEESFAKLRYHTYHLTGETYQPSYFQHGGDELNRLWRRETQSLPAELIISEPDGGFGFRTSDGHLINSDIVRYQRVIRRFHQHGIIKNLRNKHQGSRPTLLEIGTGYGGLAHHLAKAIGSPLYVLIDLPETMLFAAAYLSLLNPAKKLAVYEPGWTLGDVRSQMQSCDFVFIPNYRLDLLNGFQCDVAINLASFQEMRTAQVVQYLEMIQGACKQVLYSWNQDHQERNGELKSLSELLRTSFVLDEIHEKPDPVPVQVFKNVARRLVRLARFRRRSAQVAMPYREYLCRPMSKRAA